MKYDLEHIKHRPDKQFLGISFAVMFGIALGIMMFL